MGKLDIKKGDIFNRLTIIEEVEKYISPDGKLHRVFKCKCICGNIKNILLNKITTNTTKSCGCLVKECNKTKITHGMSKSKIYMVYDSMRKRCKFKSYKNYGGRGIKCEWNSFEEFYNDMGGTYQEGLTIDRIDVNGNYCKENCRWATWKEQQNNRRNNNIIEYNGKKMSLSMWCYELNLRTGTILERIRKGETFEKAISYKIRKYEMK